MPSYSWELLPSPVPLALHFHDTYGRAVENALCGWKEFGIVAFDASAGGLGGCPYAPGASGNVSTELLVGALCAAGARPGVDLAAVGRAVAVIAPYVGAPRRPKA